MWSLESFSRKGLVLMENNEIQDEITEVTLTDQNGQEYKVYYI
jgi:hypothetical protein